MRVLVLSDIHSNASALDAVLEKAGSFDEVWQLGDVVGYGPDPDAVVVRLRGVGAAGVRGNHDAAALGDLATSDFNSYAREAVEWTARTMDRASREWLAALPETAARDDIGLRHASYRDPVWEYITSSSIAGDSLAIVEAEGLAVGLFGHTHLPAVFADLDGRVVATSPSDGTRVALDGHRALLNPGSVGQPRDGDPRASFMLLDTERREATWRRVRYDIAAVQARFRRAGLPERLATRLDHGH
ncbi:MAG TPA: metallophosphoesterase family protein [Candidatus Dormibacteraeota bacterium]|nr:metallophosphoesterase family protein [Candidatus Dormibacteraeota bacterium]